MMKMFEAVAAYLHQRSAASTGRACRHAVTSSECARTPARQNSRLFLNVSLYPMLFPCVPSQKNNRFAPSPGIAACTGRSCRHAAIRASSGFEFIFRTFARRSTCFSELLKRHHHPNLSGNQSTPTYDYGTDVCLFVAMLLTHPLHHFSQSKDSDNQARKH